MLRIRLKDFGRLDRAKRNVDDLSGVLKSVGAFLEAVAQRNYDSRMRGGEVGGISWSPRMVPNIPGIISDLRRSSQIKARRFEERPVPFDTGLLKRSSKSRVLAKNAVEIGVTGPAQEYADVQHEGGESESETITQDVVDRIARFLDRDAGRRKRRIVEQNPRVSRLRAERDRVKSNPAYDAGLRKGAEKRLREARAEVRGAIAGGVGVFSEWFDDLAWLADDRNVGERITVNVKARPWLTLSREDEIELQTLIPEALLSKRGVLRR